MGRCVTSLSRCVRSECAAGIAPAAAHLPEDCLLCRCVCRCSSCFTAKWPLWCGTRSTGARRCRRSCRLSWTSYWDRFVIILCYRSIRTLLEYLCILLLPTFEHNFLQARYFSFLHLRGIICLCCVTARHLPNITELISTISSAQR